MKRIALAVVVLAIAAAVSAQTFPTKPVRIADFVEFDPGNAIKFTIYRVRPSGSPGDPDIFGAQQYAPLLDIEVPEK